MRPASRHGPILPPAPARTRRSALRTTLLVVGAFLAAVPAVYLASWDRGRHFTVTGNLWIDDASEVRLGDDAPGAWIELLRSTRVLAPVVVEHRLYLHHPDAYAPAFASFTLAERFRPGRYTLAVGAGGEDFTLLTDEGVVMERGALGASIGETLGFRWTPAPSAFEAGATVDFSVDVQDAVRELGQGLTVAADAEGRFIRVALAGPEPGAAADILNDVMEGWVELAGSRGSGDDVPSPARPDADPRLPIAVAMIVGGLGVLVGGWRLAGRVEADDG